MTKAESKYFNTAKRMDEAFLELMENKDLEYITVTEICKKAGVNRSTFYLHYETIGDLLSECVENMNEQFFSYFEEKPKDFEFKARNAPLEELYLITPKHLIPYLTYISEHKNVFKIVLRNPQIMQAEKTYSTIFRDTIDSILERYEIPKENREYLLSFYIEGVMGIVKRWLLRDCKDSVEYIAKIIMQVIRR